MSLRSSVRTSGDPTAAQADRLNRAPQVGRALLCVATADPGLRKRAADACSRLGHGVAEADSLESLARLAAAGVALAIIDPSLPGLGDNPVGRLRAEPALHSCPLLVLTPADIKGLRGRTPDAEFLSLIVRIQLQISGNQQIAFLHALNQALTASPDMNQTMRAVLDTAQHQLAFDTASLFLLDPLGRLRVRAASGYELDEEQLRSFKPGEGVVGWVVEHGAPTIVGDSDIDTRFASFYGPMRSRSMLAAPIMIGDRVIGALTLVRHAPATAFTDADLLPVATICNSAAIALENARLHEQERALALQLDELNRLYGQEKEIVNKLDEYDRLYTQVVATVSHELKTPLMSIRGFAKMISDGDVDTDEARDFATEIHDNAVRLSRYVERILEEAEVHQGRATVEFVDVYLAPLVDDVLRTLRQLASESHRLLNEVPADLPAVSGDSDKISRILFNLVSNAIKYSPNGGTVRVAASADDRAVELIVEDEGLGVPLEARQRIFDRFYRVSGSETEEISGTGLGLSIVRGLVELHGGRVWVDSATGGRGSRFHVTLPRVATAALPPGPAQTTKQGDRVGSTSATDTSFSPAMSRRLTA